jgi:uncharacterized protein (DUF362 family)
VSDDRINRREFLKKLGISSIGVAGAITGIGKVFGQGWFDRAIDKHLEEGFQTDVIVVEVKNPETMIEKGFDAIGGLSKYVKSGDVVFLKPNMSWNRTPEYSANTDPDVMKAVVGQIFEADAKEVIVMDNTCDDARMCYANTGVADAARDAGAKVSYFDASECENTTVIGGTVMKKMKLHREIVNADVFINLPVAKTHGISKLTLGMKNLMGCVGGNRGLWHRDLENYLPDAAQTIKPDLTIIDATTILTKGGPQGGKLSYVKEANTIIFTEDYVAADAYATGLFGMEPSDLDFVVEGAQRGLGIMNIEEMNIEKIAV